METSKLKAQSHQNKLRKAWRLEHFLFISDISSQGNHFGINGFRFVGSQTTDRLLTGMLLTSEEHTSGLKITAGQDNHLSGQSFCLRKYEFPARNG